MFFLFKNNMDLVLFGLKFTSHLLASDYPISELYKDFH